MFDENLSKNIKALAYEKSIDVERVFKALEDALATAARKYYKTREPMETVIDRASGEMTMYVIKEVVEDENQIEDPQAQWTLEQAREIDPAVEVNGKIRLSYITKEVVDVVKDPNMQIRTYEAQKIDSEVEQGDEVHIPLTKNADEFGRIAAQSAKQVLYQKVREAEREKVYNEFVGKVGELENGYVKRFERGDMIIDLNGKTEGIIPRSQQSRAERYSQGDRIKAVIVDVHTQPKGPQVVLSRTDPGLLMKLFEMEVPEIYDGTVVIKGAVREPGERAKIAVMSRERDVDPVGACVGMKGSRVQSIIRELRGEKIDIIEWSDEPSVFAANALSPAKVNQVRITDIENRQMEVIVNEDQLSLAIGKRGQNVRLATKLVGWNIDIRSEEEIKKEVAEQMGAMIASGAPVPLSAIEGVTAQQTDALAAHGVNDIDGLAATTVDDLVEFLDVSLDEAEKILAADQQVISIRDKSLETPADGEEEVQTEEIGRASCRERVE